ncbi:ribosomal protein L10e [Aspergillus heteromorphus CBS 117.55]|uniref:Ribosomal protein L10e n=1 Tax=Aspergillus heteromorphus CBS 117.55 TaxID=1448321 RepID=A0A317V6L0_9EURO|nr:ribosomal protein L10e [Aspergillus heteromorphus CBS 117.55]PWY69675.1 ribosomal protein L10e [Aspergillus heteromorphus CBS 117.55]
MASGAGEVRPCPKSRFNYDIPDLKIHIFDLGHKKANIDDFPLCIYLVSNKYEQLSSDSRPSKPPISYLVKIAGKEGFHLYVYVHPFYIICINKILSCAVLIISRPIILSVRTRDANRDAVIQAFRRSILIQVPGRQEIIPSVRPSVCTRDAKHTAAIEALRHSMYKFPGRQKIIVSEHWGLPLARREDYVQLRQEGKLKQDSAHVSKPSIIQYHAYLGVWTSF